MNLWLTNDVMFSVLTVGFIESDASLQAHIVHCGFTGQTFTTLVFVHGEHSYRSKGVLLKGLSVSINLEYKPKLYDTLELDCT